MPRPRKCRRIQATPLVDYFKPRGVPMLELTEVCLALEGLEALRLADVEGLTMEDAAARMGVSRHTFGRTLAEARRAVALALTHGQALRIEGGHYEMHEPGPLSREKEPTMTKVAVTSEGPSLKDKVDPRFGRAAGFVVVDMQTMETSYVDNGESQAMAHGAGIVAAERIAGAGASVVLTGFVGPKAFQALRGAGIEIVQDLNGLTVAEAVERYKTGLTKAADAPNK